MDTILQTLTPQSIKPKKKYHYTRKTGRPLKQLSDVMPNNWKQIIYDMSIQGCSETEIRAQIIISQGKGYKNIETIWGKLQEREVEFQRAIKICKCLCERWWTKKARDSLKSRYFHEFTWFKNMQNRFGWRDKQEIIHDFSDNMIEKFNNLDATALQKRANELLNRSRIPINTN